MYTQTLPGDIPMYTPDLPEEYSLAHASSARRYTVAFSGSPGGGA